MTKRGTGERKALHPNTVTISPKTPVDGTVNQKPQYGRKSQNVRSRQTPRPYDTTTVVVDKIIRVAAEALLKDMRKRFIMDGPDTDFLEYHDDGAISVHNNNLWKKRRARIKRPPTVAE